MCVRGRERGSRSTCVTPGERLRQSKTGGCSQRVRWKKRFKKKNHFKVYSLEEKTPHFFFLTAHEHDESWRCVHVDVREVRDNCGFAYAGQGQTMNLSQISGHGARLKTGCQTNFRPRGMTGTEPLTPDMVDGNNLLARTAATPLEEKPCAGNRE